MAHMCKNVVFTAPIPGVPSLLQARCSGPLRWDKPDGVNSAELKGPRKLVRIRPDIFDFEPDWGLKLGQTKTKISGTVHTHRHTTIPNASAPISACFDDDPKLGDCDIAHLLRPAMVRSRK